jgi:hypothetical protein
MMNNKFNNYSWIFNLGHWLYTEVKLKGLSFWWTFPDRLWLMIHECPILSHFLVSIRPPISHRNIINLNPLMSIHVWPCFIRWHREAVSNIRGFVLMVYFINILKACVVFSTEVVCCIKRMFIRPLEFNRTAEDRHDGKMRKKDNGPSNWSVIVNNTLSCHPKLAELLDKINIMLLF